MNRPWLLHYDAAVPPSLDYPEIPLYRLLDDAAAAHPDQTCTNFFGKQLSYAAIKTRSDRFAAGLQALGVMPGDHVALLLPNCPEFIVAYYAILKTGAVTVLLNPLANPHELAFLLNDCGATIIVTIPRFLDVVAGLQKETKLEHILYSRLCDDMPFPMSLVLRWQERGQVQAGVRGNGEFCLDCKEIPLPDDVTFTPVAVDIHAPAVFIYSGGTTGVAKGIMLSHYNCVASATMIRAWGQLSTDDIILSVLPLFHAYGMSVNMNASLLAGGQIVLLPRFDAREVLQTIAKRRPTFFTGVPTMFVAFSNVPDVGKYDLSSLQGIFVGAAPLTQGIKNEFEQKTGGRMIEGYGLTEAVTAIMANPYQGQHKLGSIGLPFSDVDVKIVDLATAADLPPGEMGEIVLRGPTVMLGYYQRPEQTANALRDGWLFTGDIGYMDEEGYFYITDRKKDMIIVGGFNVFPREIEEVLYRHPLVKEGVAIGIPDPYAGERIKVFVTLKEGATLGEDELIAYFREHVTRYKVPSFIEFRDELPKSMVGKILRRELRDEEREKAKA